MNGGHPRPPSYFRPPLLVGLVCALLRMPRLFVALALLAVVLTVLCFDLVIYTLVLVRGSLTADDVMSWHSSR
ncbi:MAG: hypothetical protein LC118_12275 [Dehalococcoidia bacterium]|nr:hypothetical protein [Dehalococcoidia bacterium]